MANRLYNQRYEELSDLKDNDGYRFNRNKFHSNQFVLSASEMAEVDRLSIEGKVMSGEQLMENAAESMWQAFLSDSKILEQADCLNQSLVFLCGSGNNGGDGSLMALKAVESGFLNVTLIISRSTGTVLFEQHFQNCLSHQIDNIRLDESPDSMLKAENVIGLARYLFDALLGTGYHPPMRKKFIPLILAWNSAKGLKYSIDIPSGASPLLNSTEDVFKSDVILTVELAKDFFYFPLIRPLFKRLICCHADFPSEIVDEAIEKSPRIRLDLFVTKNALTPLDGRALHKNKRGRIALFAGSPLMVGAALLSCGAALGTAAGFLRFFSHSKVQREVVRKYPSTVCGVSMRVANSRKFRLLDTQVDVIAAGPGWGINHKNRRQLAALLQSKKPLILDADAITLLSASPHLIKLATQKDALLLTPHPGEFCRLAGISMDQLNHNPIQEIKALSKKLNAVVLLKGAVSWFCSDGGTVYFFDSCRAHLATAGSGDILTGIVSAVVAGGFVQSDFILKNSITDADKLLQSIIVAVMIHAEAADNCFRKLGWCDVTQQIPFISQLLAEKMPSMREGKFFLNEVYPK